MRERLFCGIRAAEITTGFMSLVIIPLEACCFANFFALFLLQTSITGIKASAEGIVLSRGPELIQPTSPTPWTRVPTSGPFETPSYESIIKKGCQKMEPAGTKKK